MGKYPKKITFTTKHLRLRRWKAGDLAPYIQLCRDPEIMQFFNGIKAASDCFAEIEQQEICFDTYQYGIWVVELKETGEFIGAVGIEPTMLSPKGMTARLTWKLLREYWGNNYAYEANVKVINYAFAVLKVRKVIALVHPTNTRSLRLVERLGLEKDTLTDNYYFKNAEHLAS